MLVRYRGMLRERLFLPLFFISFLLLISIVVILVRDKAPAGSTAVCACEGSRGDANEVGDSNQAGEEGEEDPNDKKPPRPEHKHPAFKERISDRQRMVATQIQARQVKDPNVLKAMRIVPRHAFVPKREERYAYIDQPLPIEQGQTISQPYIVAFMTEALKLDPNSKVLEIGTGSGYQAAVCAEIAREVYTIEIVPELAKSAKALLKKLGYKNVFVRAGDGFFGWKEKGPYDAIIGTAAAGRIPPPLLEQLKPGGRMILPVRGRFGYQYLELIAKDKKGKIQKRQVMPVRFVPMTGEVQKPEKKSAK